MLLGIGNPLLDLIAEVPTSLLDKYGLEANNAILAESRHRQLYTELRDQFRVQFVAGGATQNSIRVAQWMLRGQWPGATAYLGAVGRDEFAERMRESATADGVRVQYYVHDAEPTGTCAVLVSRGGACRSLVAHLAAANTYPVSHLRQPAQWQLVERARVFYIAGFFLTVSPESALAVGEHVAAHPHKLFGMNLSAPFLLQVPQYWERFQALLPYVDVYFGNESEARVLAEQMGWTDVLHDDASPADEVMRVAMALATRTAKRTARPRTVVFTCGTEPTAVVVGDQHRLWSAEQYGVIPCPAEDLVDTNGAGDAYVGGFLATLVRGRPLRECCAAGNYAANVVIRRSGCTFPDKPSFVFRGVNVLV